MSTSYSEYGFQSEAPPLSHSDLVVTLKNVLGRPSGSVLDLGCGNGSIARMLLADGVDIFGVDASESGIRIAEQASPGRFYLLDVSSGVLPPALADKTFKTVISTEVIEHLYDPREFFNFVHRILEKAGGGEFIVATPYHGYLKNLALAITGKFDSHYSVLWAGGHIKFFSRRTLEQMLSEQGFKVTSFVGSGRLPWLWKSMIVKAVV